MISIANPDIGEAEANRVTDVLESGMLADGPVVREFESQFAQYCETAHAVATSNGTTALHAAIEALGLGEGDRVITTPFSFIASSNAIRLAGAEPVFADIDPHSYTLDPEAVRAAIEAEDGDVDAILTVHLYGLPSDMGALREIADEYDLWLIEDAAQAHGASVDGEPVGSIGDVGCFSFYPTKNMTTGEGGMIVTDTDAVAERAKRYVNHGRTSGYEHAEVGHNFRMTSIAGALGLAQLEKLPAYTEQRRENAALLNEGLIGTSVTVPVEPEGRKHVYHQYTIRTDERDALQEHLDAHDIGYGVYYPTCIHNQQAYSAVTKTAPNAEQAAREVLSLPVHPKVSAEDIETIVEVIEDYE